MFQRILLATDGSAASEHAAQTAIAMARVHKARLTAIYVVDPYPYMGVGEANPMGFDAYMSAAREHAARAHTHVDELCRQGDPVDLQLRMIEDVTALEGILNAAREESADLIVVGSHGRTGIGRALLGSVAGKVVANSKVPVLVVR
ncbi:universal stress protein [Ramlibacter rhizophilus]|uniref:Universal stress protein n=1 Tax=Ramlibacter rhizophilus TaxID=1781167 RepID=A0A4Z0BC36_9BURK|nr:universal stress protein [Ramlibacter rhizophilus]TFY96786.1 universal stress protein [Ramlibacter rhizophilus]